MNSINQCALIVASLNLFAYIYQCQGAATQSNSSTTFIATVCASKLTASTTTTTTVTGATNNATNRLFACDCLTDSSPNSSIAFKQITCTKRKLNNNDFNDYTLNDGVAVLLMGWNNFDAIPTFSGNGLTTLDLSHNNITTIDSDHTFENVTNLIELDLSWNRIATISGTAFRQLDKLKRLDISHNQLSQLTTRLFASPSALEVLILSNNERLHDQFHRQDFDLLGTLGVPTSLVRLEVNGIELKQLNLASVPGLTELFARYNSFDEKTNFTATWPHRLEIIDLSGNPFKTIPSKFWAHFSAIRELFLRRMPNLERVEPNAFINLTNLIVLDFEGSKKLSTFSANAFGGSPVFDATLKNMSHAQYLERLILRNAEIERLGLILTNSFHHLKRLDLYGNPLNCDCDLRWVAKLELDTSGRCSQPDELSGKLISNIQVKDFTCLQWPNVVYVFMHGILVLSLFAIFAIPIWLIVLFIRPRRHLEGRKIGASSPYARITIESNRAEDMYF